MSTTLTPTAGRPRAFDEEAVLNQLTALFWQQGYGHTSMSDIVEASGVHKPSLYRTFGSKDELFATVLRRYLRERMAMLTQLRAESGPGIDGIHTFFDNFEEFAGTDEGSLGCLMVMSANELRGSTPGYEDFSVDYGRELRLQMTALAANALPAGTENDSLTAQRAEILSLMFLGLQVTIRSQAGAEHIHSAFAAIHGLVDTWRYAAH
ncbi:TetR/AcrR family transcriptional regulator [Salinibacterium sp. NG253]|uniref:TetR/AcrR family transcriptional regulator n=1 Tax=Salinibacterium sp. NG253 TaxID=2792039 RepID=UPI0018CF0EB3|nr:TetR/AcrR family transcriptional regulator [Salinibacterium sp. NG253]MBH0117670.1 TetR/AcrR family transcriptional regulator [Salinibacterium sp. NG253]